MTKNIAFFITLCMTNQLYGVPFWSSSPKPPPASVRSSTQRTQVAIVKEEICCICKKPLYTYSSDIRYIPFNSSGTYMHLQCVSERGDFNFMYDSTLEKYRNELKALESLKKYGDYASYSSKAIRSLLNRREKQVKVLQQREEKLLKQTDGSLRQKLTDLQIDYKALEKRHQQLENQIMTENRPLKGLLLGVGITATVVTSAALVWRCIK